MNVAIQNKLGDVVAAATAPPRNAGEQGVHHAAAALQVNAYTLVSAPSMRHDPTGQQS
jgi:hypothetical protein